MYIQYYTTSTCTVYTCTTVHAILNEQRTSACTFNIIQQVQILNEQRTSTCTFNII